MRTRRPTTAAVEAFERRDTEDAQIQVVLEERTLDGRHG